MAAPATMTIQVGDQFVQEFLSSPCGREFADLLQGSTQLNQILDNLDTSFQEYEQAADMESDPVARVNLIERMNAVQYLREGFVNSLSANLEKLSEIQTAHDVQINFICQDNESENETDEDEDEDDEDSSLYSDSEDALMAAIESGVHRAPGQENTAPMLHQFLDETVPIPLPIWALNRTTLQFCPLESVSEVPEICIVCYDSFHVGEFLRKLPCSHRYHQSCIDTWFEQSPFCPTCKQDLRISSVS